MTKAIDTATTPPAIGRRSAVNPAGGVPGRRPHDASRRSLFAAAAAPALLALTALPTAATEPTSDAALLELGRRFEAAWTAERTAWAALDDDDESSPDYERANDLSTAVGTIVDEIERARATTLPALLVKARALRWSRGSAEPLTIGYFDLRPLLSTFQPTGEERLMVSLLTDLHTLAMGAAA